jgi:hypothetical protein
MKTTIVFFILILHVYLIFGQTPLPALFDTDTTLTKDNSPYSIGSDLTIASGATLAIEAGVIIKFASQTKMIVQGNLIASGTEEDSIFFTSLVAGEKWENISCDHANIEFYYCKVTGSKMFIGASGGDNIVVSHCDIKSTARGSGEDCIAVHDAKRVTIEYSTVTGAGGTIAEGIKNDAIDLDNVDSCFVQHNDVSHFSDDAVDIGTGTKYATISNNILSYSNYGTSVGESSTAHFINNFSCFNDGGIEVHTGASVICENNTLYSNTVGIEGYHKEYGSTPTGGTVVVKNTLFSQTHTSEITSQSSSSVTISYSLSDKEILPGENNLFDDPLLTDPENGDFSLQPGSPCFNAGEPDGEGNRINIGVFQVYNGTGVNYSNAKDPSFSVYPIPADEFVWIDISIETGEKSIAILFDRAGRIVLTKQIDTGKSYIDLKGLPSGNYFIKVLWKNHSAHAIEIIKK